MIENKLVCLFSGLTLITSSVLGHGNCPNIVWFLTEDVAKQYYQLYNNDGSGALTPNLNRLAQEGLVFSNAYSNAPVCSAARSTLITGCYASRTGMSFHRPFERVPLPDSLRMFPSYLREAGYHTSNALKTDYNAPYGSEVWDIRQGRIGDWRKRPNKAVPFFHMYSTTITHESRLHFNDSVFETQKTDYDPSKVKLSPLHPDTKLFRYTYATFYDRISDSDKQLGEMIAMLEEDGELDNTFIFYFGDNGGALPGTKGYTLETGLCVPLVVYVPKKFRDIVDFPVGSRIDGFVGFADLGPTVLKLAGVELPKKVDGKPFLGKGVNAKEVNARNQVFCYGDRYDELYAPNRVLRVGRFKYIRNYLPHHPRSLHNNYRYKTMAFEQWRDMSKAGALNPVQNRFFEPQGCEELYDLATDPWETTNLANNPQYEKELKLLRSRLNDFLLSINDLVFLPESDWLNKWKSDPTKFAKANHSLLKKYADAANLSLLPFKKAKPSLLQALRSPDDLVRYWALIAALSFGKEANELEDAITPMLNDFRGINQCYAALFLQRLNKLNAEETMYMAMSNAKNEGEVLSILGEMVYLTSINPKVQFHIDKDKLPCYNKTIARRILYINGEDWKIKVTE